MEDTEASRTKVAVLDGWTHVPEDSSLLVWHHKDGLKQAHHPFPDTVDAAIKFISLRGWKWSRLELPTHRSEGTVIIKDVAGNQVSLNDRSDFKSGLWRAVRHMCNLTTNGLLG